MTADPRAGSLSGSWLTALRGWAAAHPRVLDTALAVAVFVIALPGLSHGDRGGGGSTPPDAGTVAWLAVAAAALVLRRSHPLGVWAVALLAGLAAVLNGGGGPALALPTFLALYTVGSRAALRTIILVTVASTGADAVAMAVAEGSWLDVSGGRGRPTATRRVGRSRVVRRGLSSRRPTVVARTAPRRPGAAAGCRHRRW